MHKVFLGIGGNTGNKQNNFHKVHILIENKMGKIVLSSSVYESDAWGFVSDLKFWNQVLCIETSLTPELMLEKIDAAEQIFGRTRDKNHYSSRPMDIDILYFDDEVINTNNLVIPHPRIELRNFVLVPLTEIAPCFIHPVSKLTSIEMLNRTTDKSIVTKVLLNKAF